jgi:AcrR family transcriptional regulator
METRQQILQEVFQDMVVNGFQGTRADKVVQNLGITKGALYHHFSNKKELGYHVVEEILHPMYVRHWLPLNDYQGNPLDHIQQVLKELEQNYSGEQVPVGCPLNNLIQEMSPLDEGFRTRLEDIVERIHKLITASLKQGQMNGFVVKGIQPAQVAHFIFAAIEGSYSMAKVRKDKQAFHASMKTLSLYAESLKS